MNSYEKLLLENKAWAREKLMEDPQYFNRLAHLQTPEFLWIGCSDSRVPANEITGTAPGEIFVQRNIANMVVHTDMNLLSVLEYAVVVLKVKHIIVCAVTMDAEGVKAAMSQKSYGIINNWIRNIKDVYRLHEDELMAIADEDKRVDRLVELNVQEQVMNLAKTSIVQEAWYKDHRPHLHGWVYGLANGIIKPVFSMAPGTHIDHIYEYDNL